MDSIEAVVNAYVTPDCEISTKAAPAPLVGHQAIKACFGFIPNTYPDMIMRLHGVRLNSDKSIIFHGNFVGTKADENWSSNPDDLTSAKNDWSFVDLVKETKRTRKAERGDVQVEEISKEEHSKLQELEESVKKGKTRVQFSSSYICSFRCMRAKDKPQSGAPPTQLINKIFFDWNVNSIDQSSV